MLKIAHYDVHHFSPALARSMRRDEHSRAVVRKTKLQTVFAERDLAQAIREILVEHDPRANQIELELGICDWFSHEDDEVDYWDYDDDDYGATSDLEDEDYLDVLFDSVFFPPSYEETSFKTQSLEFIEAYAKRNPTPDWWDKEVEYQMMVDQVDREWYDLMNELEEEWDNFEEDFVRELLVEEDYLPTLEEWRWRKAV